MKQVKLIYFDGCPEARNVRAALLTAGIFDFEVVMQDELPQDHEYKRFSSPTVLNGDELIFGTRINGDMGSCTFSSGDLTQSLQKIKSLSALPPVKAPSRLTSFLGPLLAALLALKCPACIPALTAALSALGLGYLVSQTFIKSIFILLLLITIITLFLSYKKTHHNLWPFLGASFFSLIMYLGRFEFINPFLLYGGMAGLFAMVILDFALKPKRNCTKC